MSWAVDVLVVGGVFREVFGVGPDSWSRIGGSGFAAAIASARTGARTALAGCVGADEASDAIAALHDAGVQTEGLCVTAGASGIFVFEDTDDALPPRPLYRPAETEAHAPAVRLPSSRVTLAFGSPEFNSLDGRWLGPEPSDILIWDRQGWLSRTRSSGPAASVSSPRKVFLGNRHELQEEFGPELAVAILQGAGVPGFDSTFIKFGPWGVVELGREIRGVPAFAVKVVSSIGGGDVFAGVLAASMAQGRQSSDAGLLAAAGAALSMATGKSALDATAPDAIVQLLAKSPRAFVAPSQMARLGVSVAAPDTVEGRFFARRLEAMVRNLRLPLVSVDESCAVLAFGEAVEDVTRLAGTHQTVLSSADPDPVKVVIDLRDRLIAFTRRTCGEPRLAG